MIDLRQHCNYKIYMTDDKTRPYQMRVTEEWLAIIDEWRRKQADIPSRAEAIRRLTALGIGAEPILRDLLAMIERLPSDPELDRHAETIRALLELRSQSE